MLFMINAPDVNLADDYKSSPIHTINQFLILLMNFIHISPLALVNLTLKHVYLIQAMQSNIFAALWEINCQYINIIIIT